MPRDFFPVSRRRFAIYFRSCRTCASVRASCLHSTITGRSFLSSNDPPALPEDHYWCPCGVSNLLPDYLTNPADPTALQLDHDSVSPRDEFYCVPCLRPSFSSVPATQAVTFGWWPTNCNALVLKPTLPQTRPVIFHAINFPVVQGFSLLSRRRKQFLERFPPICEAEMSGGGSRDAACYEGHLFERAARAVGGLDLRTRNRRIPSPHRDQEKPRWSPRGKRGNVFPEPRARNHIRLAWSP